MESSMVISLGPRELFNQKLWSEAYVFLGLDLARTNARSLWLSGFGFDEIQEKIRELLTSSAWLDPAAKLISPSRIHMEVLRHIRALHSAERARLFSSWINRVYLFSASDLRRCEAQWETIFFRLNTNQFGNLLMDPRLRSAVRQTTEDAKSRNQALSLGLEIERNRHLLSGWDQRSLSALGFSADYAFDTIDLICSYNAFVEVWSTNMNEFTMLELETLWRAGTIVQDECGIRPNPPTFPGVWQLELEPFLFSTDTELPSERT